MSLWNGDVITSVVMPLAGLALGALFYFRHVRGQQSLPLSWRRLFENHFGLILCSVSLAVLALTFALCSLRYLHFHSAYYDLGSYENKIWQISRAFPSLQSLRLSLTGHFQPILLVYAALYKMFPSPLPLLFLQAAAVTSGVIPLYLLAKDKLRKPAAAGVIVFMYLLYPAVQFNMFFDFHPDHLYIPCALWAFYFAHRKKFAASMLTIAIGCLAKEPFFLAAAFFGLYLIVEHKKFRLGSLSMVFFILAFVLVFYYVQPLRYQYDSESSYGYLAAIFRSPAAFWTGLIHNLHPKINFIQFLMFPFLYLPFVRWRELLPAAPLACIHLLSTSLNRYNAVSQYTAGFIPCIIVAFIAVLHARSVKKGETRATAWLGMTFIVMVFMSAARGPSPLSVKFWVKPWSADWNYANYVQTPHEAVLKEALGLIPLDENIRVVTQNNVNHSQLARRWHCVPFPHDLDAADYVLLDTSKPLFVFDYVDPRVYGEFLSKLEADPAYDRVFSKDGVKVFKRKAQNTGISHPGG